VTSIVTADFLARFGALPPGVQRQARRAYRHWKENPAHPGVRFKPIQGQDGLYSARVGRGWRALGRLDGDTVTWFWIGSHADYDALIG